MSFFPNPLAPTSGTNPASLSTNQTQSFNTGLRTYPGVGGIASEFPGSGLVYSGPRLYAAGCHRGEDWNDSSARPLRVIHVGQFMMRGGIEMWLKGLIRHADPRRLQVARCVVTNGDYFDSCVGGELGVPIEVGGRESVRQAVRDCDVLLISGPGEVGEWLADVTTSLRVFVAHGDLPPYRSVLKAAGPAINHVIAVSQRVREKVCSGFPTTVIYNGGDAAHVAASRSREATRQAFGFGPHNFVLGYVGRFSEEKRPDALIRAVAKLPHNFKGLLAGWGHMRPQLLDMANQLAPSRIVFANGDRAVGDTFQAMDAYAMTSAAEGFGLVVLEAMFAERPVISGPVGVGPELLTNRVNGLLVDGTVDSFAEAAKLLAANPDWARGVAREGRRLADAVGHASLMARHYADLFDRLLGREAVAKESHGFECHEHVPYGRPLAPYESMCAPYAPQLSPYAPAGAQG